MGSKNMRERAKAHETVIKRIKKSFTLESLRSVVAIIIATVDSLRASKREFKQFYMMKFTK
jgi:hypothetical protein